MSQLLAGHLSRFTRNTFRMYSTATTCPPTTRRTGLELVGGNFFLVVVVLMMFFFFENPNSMSIVCCPHQNAIHEWLNSSS